MSRIIIENWSDVSDSYAVGLVQRVVQRVIDQGRISRDGKQYCFASRFPYIGAIVFTDLNKRSDRFIVCNDKTPLVEDKA